MKFVKMKKEELDFFVSVLSAFGEVHAPIKRGQQVVIGTPARWSDVCLEYARTTLPPKKYVLPPREVMFSFDGAKGYQDLLNEARKPIVLFGVHSYDIYSLNILDTVFLGGSYKDPYYSIRRENLAVIGIDFQPDEHHFAYSTDTDFVDHGFDLFFHDIGDFYLIRVGTSRGDDMANKSGCLFIAPEEKDFKEFKRRSAQRRAAYVTHVDLRDLPEILEMEYRSHIWEEIGERCLSCGTCSFVCPTCYCYDVRDECSIGDRCGQRSRYWDSCLYRTHALVAGGENFRKDRASRIKFRYYHKQRGFVAEYGRPSCVGCGRCIVACPAKIDIVSVIMAVRGEKDAHGNKDFG